MRIEILITEELNGSQIKLDKEVNSEKDLYSLLDLAEKCSSHFLPDNDLEEFFEYEQKELAKEIEEHEEAYAKALNVKRGGKIERD
jgi:hypothetical protein